MSWKPKHFNDDDRTAQAAERITTQNLQHRKQVNISGHATPQGVEGSGVRSLDKGTHPENLNFILSNVFHGFVVGTGNLNKLTFFCFNTA